MIFSFDKFKNINTYGLKKNVKEKIFLSNLKKITLHHINKCKEYKIIIDSLGFKIKNLFTINNVPYLTTRLFKNFELKSIKNRNIFKTLN